MKLPLFVALTMVPFNVVAASTLECFGFHGPKASSETSFVHDVDITEDLRNPHESFKTYSMIKNSKFEIDVTISFPQEVLSLNLTKGDFVSMSVGKFEGTKLVLADAKTKKSLVYVECGVVTKN